MKSINYISVFLLILLILCLSSIFKYDSLDKADIDADICQYELHEINDDSIVNESKRLDSNIIIDSNDIEASSSKDLNKKEYTLSTDSDLLLPIKVYQNEIIGIYTNILIDYNDIENSELKLPWPQKYSIDYPQMLYLNENYNSVIENKINTQLFDAAFGRFGYEILRDKERTTHTLSIDYEITEISTEYISVLFTGLLQTIWRHHSFRYAVTIDTNTGELIGLSNFFGLAEKIINPDMQLIIVDEEVFYDEEEHAEWVANFIQEINDHDVYHNYYIFKGEIYLLVPTERAAQEYSTVKIEY